MYPQVFPHGRLEAVVAVHSSLGTAIVDMYRFSWSFWLRRRRWCSVTPDIDEMTLVMPALCPSVQKMENV